MYHIEYRPKNWEEVVGHSSIVNGLKEQLSDLDTCSHAFLFSGPRGTGKTTFAKLIAEELSCSEKIYEINCNVNRGVEFFRKNIVSNLNFKPIRGKIKFYLFDEFHQATGDAQQSLLSPLEDGCPNFVYFAFCSTEPQKIKRTIRSRCAHYQLNPLSRLDIEELVDWVVRSEKLKLKQGVVDVIVREADGIPREALVYLNMVKHCKSEEEASELIEYGETADRDMRKVARALLNHESWNKVIKLYEELENKEPEGLRVAFCNYFKKVVLNKKSKKEGEWAFFLMDKFMGPMIGNTAEAEIIWALYECSGK